jgi:hypothetical protein
VETWVFDLTERRAEFAFGSSAANGWRTFSLAGRQLGMFKTRLAYDQTDPSFWQPVEWQE